MKSSPELRYITTEIRAAGGKLSGYAARYNVNSRFIPEIGGIERVLPGAFDRSVDAAEAGEQDITLNCSHNEMFTLGSVAMGNLRVSSDDKGLRFDVTPPSTEYAKAAVEAVREGRMNGCSFSFLPVREARASDGARELRDVVLQHITICKPELAAYPAAGVEARAALGLMYRSVGSYELRAEGLDFPTSGRTLNYNDPLDRSIMDRELHRQFLSVGGESRVYTSMDQVPAYVPNSMRKQWMDIWNSAYKAAKKVGLPDKNAESKAFAEASGVIKKEIAK